MATESVSRRGFIKLGGLGLTVGGLALAGCGQGGQSSSTATNGRKQINFVTAKFEASTSMQSFVDAFNQSQGKLQVAMSSCRRPARRPRCTSRWCSSWARRNGNPDVFTQDIVWIAEFAAAGWALSLDDVVDQAARRRYFPGIVEACTWQRQAHGTALVSRTRAALITETDLLGRCQAPETWEKLVEASQKLRRTARPGSAFSGRASRPRSWSAISSRSSGSNSGGSSAPTARPSTWPSPPWSRPCSSCTTRSPSTK